MKTTLTTLASFASLLSRSYALVLANPINPDGAMITRRGCLNDDTGITNWARDTSHQGVKRNGFHRRQSVNTTSASCLAVDVHMHIASSEAQADLITNATVTAQFQALHDVYALYNINLTLASTSRTVDNLTAANFFVKDPQTGWGTKEAEKRAFLKATRKGGYGALNLYFFTTYLPGATGYCNWPQAISDEGDDDDVFWADGCSLHANTMPGLPVEYANENWNMGHMAIHETGHWFGLNHTFAGGCTEPGDFVADTPAHELVYGCPAGKDTCPGLAGLDPIHNFMGYTSDNWYVLCSHCFSFLCGVFLNVLEFCFPDEGKETADTAALTLVQANSLPVRWRECSTFMLLTEQGNRKPAGTHDLV